MCRALSLHPGLLDSSKTLRINPLSPSPRHHNPAALSSKKKKKANADPSARTQKCAFTIVLIRNPHSVPGWLSHPSGLFVAAVIWAVPQWGCGTHGCFQGIRVTHCSEHPPSARVCPAVRGSSPSPTASPRLFATIPLSPLPPLRQRLGLRKPGCRVRTPRRPRTGPARLLTPASGAGLLAALRGAGTPGSAPAASRARPPPGLGPAAATLCTPAVQRQRQRQQLQPRYPSSYFSDGSSRCCLGKRFFPLPETDFLHFISPHRPSGSKMLTFSGGQQRQLTLIYPSNGERLYYKLLAAIPRLGPNSSPLLVPQTLT